MYHSEMLCCAPKRRYKIHPLYKVNGNDYFLKSTKGQLISKGIFGVFKSTRNFCKDFIPILQKEAKSKKIKTLCYTN